MRTCPRCTLLNPDTALLCDCGFKFVATSPRAAQAELPDARARAQRDVIVGLFLAGCASAISIMSFVEAKPGGMYIVAHGAVAFGVLMIGRGLSARRRLANVEKDR